MKRAPGWPVLESILAFPSRRWCPLPATNVGRALGHGGCSVRCLGGKHLVVLQLPALRGRLLALRGFCSPWARRGHTHACTHPRVHTHTHISVSFSPPGGATPGTPASLLPLQGLWIMVPGAGMRLAPEEGRRRRRRSRKCFRSKHAPGVRSGPRPRMAVAAAAMEVVKATGATANMSDPGEWHR